MTHVGRSVLEERFWWTWQHALRGPALEREYPCCPGRRFRLDFAHPPTRVGIELHGGVWTGGRHTSGAGFSRDCEKRCLLAAQGWLLFELTADMVLKAPLTWAGLIHETITRRLVEVDNAGSLVVDRSVAEVDRVHGPHPRRARRLSQSP